MVAVRRLRFILVCALLLLPCCLRAQSHDFGGLLNIGFEQKITKGFNFNAEAEGRFNQCLTHFDRLKIGTAFDYSFLKKRLKVAVGANYLLYNQLGTAEHRGRIHGTLTYSEKIWQFKLSFRVRVQSTFYDELRSDPKFNPKTYLRNRLQFEYAFFGKPMSIYASTEFFLRLYKKNNHFIDNFRTILGWDYKLNQGNTIGLFFRMDNEIQVSDPENVYYIGFKYGFKNK